RVQPQAVLNLTRKLGVGLEALRELLHAQHLIVFGTEPQGGLRPEPRGLGINVLGRFKLPFPDLGEVGMERIVPPYYHGELVGGELVAGHDVILLSTTGHSRSRSSLPNSPAAENPPHLLPDSRS